MKNYIFILKTSFKKELINNVYVYQKTEQGFDIDKIKKSAQEFYNRKLHFLGMREKQKLIKQIENFSIYERKNYKKYDREVISSLIMILSIYVPHVTRQLAVHSGNKRYMDYGGLKRKASPPDEAYEYTGTSKLDINPQPPTWML